MATRPRSRVRTHIAVWDHPTSEAFCSRFSGRRHAVMSYIVDNRAKVCKRCLCEMDKRGVKR